MLELPAIDIELPLAELYERVLDDDFGERLLRMKGSVPKGSLPID
ncbi:MAG TPA: hypothetical protein VNR89_17605 [Roseomonas sp.]|nr:hypothetical protein [Roseomonas sp.]